MDDLKKSQVFWVGLSAVKVSDIKNETPLSPNTNSGKLISNIEQANNHVDYYKTNLVKCLPLKDNKIRYPKTDEMERCFSNLQIEVKKSKPKIIFLLGKAVSDFIINVEKTIKPFLNDEFEYQSYEINKIQYIPIHHPSYILVYKRKFLDKYMSSISSLLANFSNI